MSTGRKMSPFRRRHFQINFLRGQIQGCSVIKKKWEVSKNYILNGRPIWEFRLHALPFKFPHCMQYRVLFNCIISRPVWIYLILYDIFLNVTELMWYSCITDVFRQVLTICSMYRKYTPGFVVLCFYVNVIIRFILFIYRYHQRPLSLFFMYLTQGQLYDCPGSAFIKPDQRNPWIKDQIKITLLPTISHLLLPNFVSCGRACPSHMTQNLVTVGAKLWTADRFIVDPWSMDYADPVW